MRLIVVLNEVGVCMIILDFSKIYLWLLESQKSNDYNTNEWDEIRNNTNKLYNAFQSIKNYEVKL